MAHPWCTLKTGIRQLTALVWQSARARNMSHHMLEMSVVLITLNHYDVIRKAIRCLRAQTARDKLEIIIVAPSAHELKLDETELKGFGRWRVEEVGPIESTGEALAHGVRRATAPVVA